MTPNDDTEGQSQSLILVLVDPNGKDEHYAIIPFPETYANAKAAAIKTLRNYMDGNEPYVILRRSIKNRRGEWVWADIPPEHWKTMVKRGSTEVGVFARPRYAPGPFLHGLVHFTYGRERGDGISWQSVSHHRPQIHSQKAMARPKSFAEAVKAARAKLAVLEEPLVSEEDTLRFCVFPYGSLFAWILIPEEAHTDDALWQRIVPQPGEILGLVINSKTQSPRTRAEGSQEVTNGVEGPIV